MAYPAVSVNAEVYNVGHFQITLAQTGPDTANINVREWPPGLAIGVPESSQDYDVTNVRVDVAHDMITCQTKSFFLTPVITFILSDMNRTPSVTIEITHALFKNGTTTYPISAEDRKALSDFLAAAQFPGM